MSRAEPQSTSQQLIVRGARALLGACGTRTGQAPEAPGPESSRRQLNNAQACIPLSKHAAQRGPGASWALTGDKHMVDGAVQQDVKALPLQGGSGRDAS